MASDRVHGALWTLDLSTLKWMEITPSDGPTRRTSFRMAFARGSVLLFAGSDVRGTNDLGATRPMRMFGKRWGSGTIVRQFGGVRQLRGTSKLIAFGGTDEAVFLNDLWQLCDWRTKTNYAIPLAFRRLFLLGSPPTKLHREVSRSGPRR